MTNEETWLLSEKYNGKKTNEFYADMKRLEAGEPLAYVIGHVPFLGTTITLGSHPLIPRPETEYWVESAIRTLKAWSEQPMRVLDLCAGSGCIGLAVLHAIPWARVDFAEINPRHIDTIRENLKRNNIAPERTHVIQSNLYADVPGTYDAIFTNPPYIDPAIDRTEEAVRRYEPAEALYGGEGGLFFISEIIRKAPEHLTPHGVLYLEHEPEHVSAIQKAADDVWLSTETFPDQYGVMRFTRMTRRNGKTVRQ